MIQAASQRISAITSEVQDAVMRTRMQTIGNLFQKFPRVVREIGRKLGKDVRLIEEGGDVELDKTIIEGLSDPLTHMVRNSIDHGIETAEARAALGKPAAGTVYLRAWHEAGVVVVEVADDGRGLDPETIGAAAVKRGLVSEQAVAGMSEPEKLSLVFLPGLSTAQSVGDLSGRGVGLDVVKTNLDRLGGSVEIHSQAGVGAAFRIKLPLTLAIIPSLLVSAGSERMAIPLGTVQELVRVPKSEVSKRVDRAGSAKVLMLREGVLPLVRLDRALGLAPPADSGAALNIVVLSSGGFRYGLVVDRLHGTVEIVVKPVGRHLRHLREYAGATILGDGCVALILDVPGLATAAGLTGGETAARPAETAEAPQETHQLLVFRNSPTEPCAVPLHAASRLLKIKPEDVEHVGGRRTMQQQGRSLPLATLADLAAAAAPPLYRNSIVVVMEAGGREFGLLAALPVDVVEAAVEIDARTLRQPGVMGSTVLRGETTLLLDAAALARSACPSGAPETRETGRLSGARVLIAEDSSFYRELVTKVVESEGAEAVVVGDGEAAWEVLERRAEDLSLVITDVEMPRMDGFALTRRIRSNPRTARMPVIVLTSLDGDEDRQRGGAAGATAYCIKLDQDELVTAAAGALLGGERGTSDLEQLARHVRADAPAAAGALAESGERR
jgi:two-component system chemotaxis sensor kinase CheA